MKRHLINDDINEMNRCFSSGLVIIGKSPTLVRQDCDCSESEHRVCKRRKLQQSQEQGNSTKIEDDRNHNDTTTSTNKKDDYKLRFLNLVSSAVNIMCKEQNELENHDDDGANHQTTQRDMASSSISSEVSTASTTRTSRSDSISSEYSAYRSYEMELPDISVPLHSIKGRLPSQPRLPTASNLPITNEVGSQLNSRRYGLERPCFGSNNEQLGDSKINLFETKLTDQILVRSVIYR